MNPITVFDCETGPLPLEHLGDLKPEFKADSRLKDPDRIKANILEKEQAWKDELALSAVTGRVLVVGTLTSAFPNFIDGGGDERKILEDFWEGAKAIIQTGGRLVGFCCKSFDLPFLIRRSWKLGVPVPFCIWDGRYFANAIVDVAERWACGGREPRDRISLDTLSKFLGTGAKLGEGKDFAALWGSDRPAALEYLKMDLTLTKLAYERLFVS